MALLLTKVGDARGGLGDGEPESGPVGCEVSLGRAVGFVRSAGGTGRAVHTARFGRCQFIGVLGAIGVNGVVGG